MTIRDYQDTDEFLRKAIERDRQGTKNLQSHENFYNHSKGVSKSAYSTACTLSDQGRENDTNLVRISGLLHDIGKAIATPEYREKDPELIFDSIYGYEWLIKMGLPKVAETIFPSFTLKELMDLQPDIFPEYADGRIELLEPVTLEQKLVVYGDAYIDGQGNVVTFEQRMGDMRTRYSPDSLLVKSLDMGGEERLRVLCEEIDNLTQ